MKIKERGEEGADEDMIESKRSPSNNCFLVYVCCWVLLKIWVCKRLDIAKRSHGNLRSDARNPNNAEGRAEQRQYQITTTVLITEKREMRAVRERNRDRDEEEGSRGESEGFYKVTARYSGK